MRKYITLLISVVVMVFGFTGEVLSKDEKVAGTFFGDPVSKYNYDFILRTVIRFSSPWGGIPRTQEDLEKRIWDDLILSYEAHRRGIIAERSEVEKRIAETLKDSNVKFDWKTDPVRYEEWVKKTLGHPVEVFENQMRHLIMVRMLHAQVLESIDPVVTQEEAFQEFRNEQNSLSVELAEFDKFDEAQQFYQKVQSDPSLWEKAAEEDRKLPREDRSFQKPGFVALEFLMDLWQFPKKAVFDMITMTPGDVYPPAPIYEGYGVFKIIEIRLAVESEFPNREKSYFEQLRSIKKYKGFTSWLEQLKEDADIQVYMDVPMEIFQ